MVVGIPQCCCGVGSEGEIRVLRRAALFEDHHLWHLLAPLWPEVRDPCLETGFRGWRVQGSSLLGSCTPMTSSGGRGVARPGPFGGGPNDPLGGAAAPAASAVGGRNIGALRGESSASSASQLLPIGVKEPRVPLHRARGHPSRVCMAIHKFLNPRRRFASVSHISVTSWAKIPKVRPCTDRSCIRCNSASSSGMICCFTRIDLVAGRESAFLIEN